MIKNNLELRRGKIIISEEMLTDCLKSEIPLKLLFERFYPVAISNDPFNGNTRTYFGYSNDFGIIDENSDNIPTYEAWFTVSYDDNENKSYTIELKIK